jgi:hypothetical protein
LNLQSDAKNVKTLLKKVEKRGWQLYRIRSKIEGRTEVIVKIIIPGSFIDDRNSLLIAKFAGYYIA